MEGKVFELKIEVLEHPFWKVELKIYSKENNSYGKTWKTYNMIIQVRPCVVGIIFLKYFFRKNATLMLRSGRKKGCIVIHRKFSEKFS